MGHSRVGSWVVPDPAVAGAQQGGKKGGGRDNNPTDDQKTVWKITPSLILIVPLPEVMTWPLVSKGVVGEPRCTEVMPQVSQHDLSPSLCTIISCSLR